MDRDVNVSIVVLTYNRRDCVRELLLNLLDLKTKILELIIVDNCSQDGTETMIREEFPTILYLRNDSNLGACGRNRGMMAAQGDIIITLDDDILGIEAIDLERIERRFNEVAALGAVNFRVVDHETGKVCNWVHHCPSSRALDSFPTYEITEGAVAFRGSALREVGYYWNPFFISQEGVDLAFRLMDAGYEVLYDGNIVVRHKFESSGRLSWRFYYYDTRNQILLAARRMRWRLGLKYLAIGLPAMAFYSLRDGFGRWWLKGLVDGMGGLRAALRTRQPMLPATERRIRQIDKERPPFLTQVRKRLFEPANRLGG